MDTHMLDRRIEILGPVSEQNDLGEVQSTDALLATVSAQVIPIGGRETFMASQMVPEAVFKIRIRYRSAISPLNKVRFEGTTYDVAHVAEIGRRQGLELLVKFP
jgi:SPP1 family predicted phage head-tail adaptor